MEKIKAKPMQIKTFLLFWLLAVYLLWPLQIIPFSIVLYLLPPYSPDKRMLYWIGFDDKAIFVAIFTFVMAYVQAWLFRRLLYIQFPRWQTATIVGGLLGALLMWILRWNPPFEMFSWFFGIGLAQAWVLRKRAKNAWLWLLAHLCLSLFFPIYGNNSEIIVAKWLISTSVYATGTLLVLREIGKTALSPVTEEV